MVECNLAKVEAEGSNPFFRSFQRLKQKQFWMSDRVVEGASLENWSIFWYRGFESLLVRRLIVNFLFE